MKKCNHCQQIKEINLFVKKSNDKYRPLCKDCYSLKRKEYYQKNKEVIKEKSKNWKLKNPDKFKKYYTEYNKTISDKKRQYQRQYQREYMKNRKETDKLFKLSDLIRSKIRKCFNGYKSKKTTEILGCSFEEFKIYLESKFEYWMNWDNHGLYNGELNYGWDIDHIIPISSAKTEEDIIKLNHYTNLRPLCSYYNRVIKRNYS